MTSLPRFRDGRLASGVLIALAAACGQPSSDPPAALPAGAVRLTSADWQELKLQTVDDMNRPSFEEAFAKNNGFRLFVQNGSATYLVDSPPGPVRVQLKAAGALGDGRYPRLEIDLRRNGSDTSAPPFSEVVGHKTVQLTGEPQNYEADFNTPAAEPLQLRLTFEDDFYSPDKGDRNVMLFAVTAKAGH